jgi:peptide/nickel transport system permease protein
MPFSFIKNQTFKKFLSQGWGVAGLVFVILTTLFGIFAYPIASDASENANQMHLSIHSKPPGFRVNLIKIPLQKGEKSSWSRFWSGHDDAYQHIAISSYFIQNDTLHYKSYSDTPELAVDGYVTHESFGKKSWEDIKNNHIINQKFIWGTDKYGRDLFSRMLIGTRISISVGFIAVLISLILGVFLGAIGGYYGGKTDALVMWLINVIWSIPTLLLVIAMTLALGKGFWQVFIAVGLTMWVEVARVVRGQVLGIKRLPYITAAKALGFSNARIIIKHILPNCIPPIVVISAANFASAILIESGLSFLGLGVQPPTPSWGGIIKDHYHYVVLGKPYLALVPGLAIMLLTLSFMMVGNAIRDTFDVKSN